MSDSPEQRDPERHAEKKALQAFGDQVHFFACGKGFTWETQNIEEKGRWRQRPGQWRKRR